MIKPILCAVAMCASLASAWAQTPPAPSGVGQALPGLEAFDEAMTGLLQKHGFPGGTLAVAFQGRLVLNKAYGSAQKSGGTPMAAGQRMRIASMSKMITAAAALKAAEAGLLDLDKPFTDVLGYSQKASDYADARVLQITTRQLLQNHAGWTIDRQQDPMLERVPPCPGRAARWLSAAKLDAAPGMLYSYSNINFCLAQLVIEKTTGQKYADYVKAKIAQPAGISSWEVASLRGKADEPEYVPLSGEKMLPYVNIDFEALGGAGAWTSTAADYVRFLVALRGQRGEPVLKAESLAQLTGAPAAPSAGPLHYGLGANVRRMDGGRFNFWHHGSLPGTSSLGVSYSSGWAFAVIFNARTAGADDRSQSALDVDRSLGQAVAKSKAPASGEVAP
jgi:CubicO group peptidase (beta-lactamase class C family)